jgi:uncharacterized RDD family membrane protein YckC
MAVKERDTAPLLRRSVAYLLDVLLAILLAMTLLLLWIYPRQQPEGWALLQNFQSSGQRIGSAFFTQLPAVDRLALARLLLATQITVTGTIFLYFWLSELFSQGSSLGKCMFRLRVVEVSTGKRPTAAKLFLRSAISSICLTMNSLFLLPNFLWGLFRRDRRCWHELASGSRVVRY